MPKTNLIDIERATHIQSNEKFSPKEKEFSSNLLLLLASCGMGCVSG